VTVPVCSQMCETLCICYLAAQSQHTWSPLCPIRPLPRSFEDVIGPAMDAMRNITLESFGTDYDTDGGVSCKVRAAACSCRHRRIVARCPALTSSYDEALLLYPSSPRCCFVVCRLRFTYVTTVSVTHPHCSLPLAAPRFAR